MLRRPLLSALGLVLLVGCSGPMEVEGLSFMPQPGWNVEQTDSPSRVVQYALPGASSEQDDAELVIYYFGADGAGSIDANLQRWCDQFNQPDGSETADAAAVAVDTREGLQFNTIEVSGTYVAETIPGSRVFHNRPDYRMLAAIVTTEAGPYYVKLVGPETTVARWEHSYHELLASMRPTSRPTVTPAFEIAHP